ncbi:hypothetical protein [Psychrobium sp. 1_MG-2023]|uniref:hypothetical protein n=1 Tax=Psychrobium sp. 1_MG-2023 TaxID=3062624 RepID=UPI000C32A3B1|nr:hypothetical protein [Psychrobium sp. 1_MG-2023]MDP2562857.1 hypothetical protein [Psychrobium sp. 1_MG-2023]PKF53977.1 hypothetical protein CW748_17395 [Alteromonadales bacterium alter-6D02]
MIYQRLLTRPRTIVCAILSPILFSVTGAVAAAQSQVEHHISDLDYGVALYHYYQGNHEQALTELAIIEKQRTIKHQGLAPELVKGGMSLSYGLYEQANSIFTQLLSAQGDTSIQADAWFYSGQLHYQEANWLAATRAFSKVSSKLSNKHRDEFYYFKAQLALKSLDFEQYQQYKQLISDSSSHEPQELNPAHHYHQYLDHNHLLQKISAKQLTFADLTLSISGTNPEMIALADRSYLAMGYAFIEQGNSHAAINAFKQVSLDSYLFDPAILGYAWALSSLGLHGQAQSILNKLTSKPELNVYVQEALLAQAYASEQLGDEQGAVIKLTSALKRFKQQQEQLEVMQGLLTRGHACYNAMILKKTVADCNASQQFNDLALIELLSDTRFSTYQAQLQQVNQLKQQFKQQRDKLEIYQQMLIEKKHTAQARLGNIELATLKTQVVRLSEQRDSLVSRIHAAKGEDDGEFFLPAAQVAHQQKVTQALDTLALLKSKGHDVTEQARRLSFIQRLALWQQDYDYALNVNTTMQLLKQLNAELSQLLTSYQQLAKHVAQVANIDAELKQIGRLQDNINQQFRHSAAISERIEQEFAVALSDYFTQRQQQLQHNIAAAKLAVVQMQDVAYRPDDIGDANE